MNFDNNMKKNSKLRWQNKHLSILTCVAEAYSKPFSFFTFVEGFKCIFLPNHCFHRLVSFMSYISVNLALRNSKVLKMYPCGILKDWKRNSSAHFCLLKVPIDFYLEKDLEVRSMIIRFRDYLHFGNLMYLPHKN